jgi:hypothetical protein
VTTYAGLRVRADDLAVVLRAGRQSFRLTHDAGSVLGLERIALSRQLGELDLLNVCETRSLDRDDESLHADNGGRNGSAVRHWGRGMSDPAGPAARRLASTDLLGDAEAVDTSEASIGAKRERARSGAARLHAVGEEIEPAARDGLRPAAAVDLGGTGDEALSPDVDENPKPESIVRLRSVFAVTRFEAVEDPGFARAGASPGRGLTTAKSLCTQFDSARLN